MPRIKVGIYSTPPELIGGNESAIKKTFIEPLINILDDFIVNNFNVIMSSDETFVIPYTITNAVNLILDEPKSNITFFLADLDSHLNLHH